MWVTIPSICLRGLSYLYLAFLTLEECLLFLIFGLNSATFCPNHT